MADPPKRETQEFLVAAGTDQYTYTNVIVGTGPDAIRYKYPDNLWESDGGIWFLMIDRQTLKAPFSVFQEDLTEVPAGIDAYYSDKYVVVCASYNLNTRYPPQGAMYQWIDQFGGGVKLRQVAQVHNQLGCGNIARQAYVMTNVMFDPKSPPDSGTSDPTDSLGIEAAVYTGSGAILFLEMSRFVLPDGSKTPWTPSIPTD